MSITANHIISLSEDEKEKIKEFIKNEGRSKRLI